jgi:AcrR family transcriptional regulator
MLNMPTRRGQATRERLLDAAERAVVESGVAAVSVEALIAEAGVTRSSFFYHFKDKTELARALILRAVERERDLLDGLCRRAEELDDDPLHACLVGLKLLSEVVADLPGRYPGMLAAALLGQSHGFDREVRILNAEGVRAWRERFRERFARIAERHPPRRDVDLDDLADMAAAVVKGAFILPRQVLLYRDYVQSVFQSSGPARPVPAATGATPW